MTRLLPWAVDESGRREIEQALKVLTLGRRVTSWQCLYPKAWGFHAETQHAGFDIADLELALHMEDTTWLSLSWLTEGFQQGLVINTGVGIESIPRDDQTARDLLGPLTDRVPHGTSIENIAVAWHQKDTALPQALWSIRFAFENGRSIVAALGGVDDEGKGLMYHPHSIAVIYDEALARTYGTETDSVEPAWGHEV